LIKLYGSIGTILQKEGVLIVEEADRFYSVCMLRGYKDFLLERHDKRVLSSLFTINTTS